MAQIVKTAMLFAVLFPTQVEAGAHSSHPWIVQGQYGDEACSASGLKAKSYASTDMCFLQQDEDGNPYYMRVACVDGVPTGQAFSDNSCTTKMEEQPMYPECTDVSGGYKLMFLKFTCEAAAPSGSSTGEVESYSSAGCADADKLYKFSFIQGYCERADQCDGAMDADNNPVLKCTPMSKKAEVDYSTKTMKTHVYKTSDCTGDADATLAETQTADCTLNDGVYYKLVPLPADNDASHARSVVASISAALVAMAAGLFAASV